MVARRRSTREAELRLGLAWQTAALCGLAWVGKLPKLDTLLAAPRNGTRQRPEQQRTVMQMLSARYGIPLRRTRLIRREATA